MPNESVMVYVTRRVKKDVNYTLHSATLYFRLTIERNRKKSVGNCCVESQRLLQTEISHRKKLEEENITFLKSMVE